MLDTFFMVTININKSLIVNFGPYITIEEATKILVDLAPIYAEREVNDGKYRYSAAINECILNENNKWENIYTPIKENECYKRKLTH